MKSLSLLLLITIFSCGSIPNSTKTANWDPSFYVFFSNGNLDTISVKYYLEKLVTFDEEVVYIEHTFRRNFVQREDLLFLVSYLGDNRPCPAIIRSEYMARYTDARKSTVGFEAYRLLNGYFLGMYPVGRVKQVNLPLNRDELFRRIEIEISQNN